MLVAIHRFYNNEKYIQNYDVEIKSDDTLLDVLEKIGDRTLSYRAFCRSAICGSCAMVVNGKSVLACKVNANSLVVDDKLEIEPLRYQKVIKDLVTDIEPALNKLKKVNAWFVADDKEKNYLPTDMAMIDKQTDCILCMACWSECEPLENSNSFAGPFAFTKLNRFLMDKHDKRDESSLLQIAKDNGMYECIQCNKCVMACPKGVASAFDIKNIMNKDMAGFAGNNFGVSFF